MDSCEVNDHTNAGKVASLLGITKQSLCEALTRKTIFAHGDRVATSISKDTAIEGRDAFVKAIYGRIFLRIVNRINDTIFKIKPNDNVRTIGVLDIFGFENFLLNSFEQLCINYANENLQQFFVQHIFKVIFSFLKFYLFGNKYDKCFGFRWSKKNMQAKILTGKLLTLLTINKFWML